MKRGKRLSRLVLSLIVIVMLLPVSALAAGKIDLRHDRSLKVTAVYETQPISGMQFDAYLISNVDEFGELKETTPYQEYRDALDIRGKNDEAWQEMALLLERKIILDGSLKPSRSAVTDKDGVAEFLDIPMGLYLIIGNAIQKNSHVYTTSPFFVMIPKQDLSSNTWDYHIVAKSKPKQNPVVDDFKVIKEWVDEFHKNPHPQSVTIQLLCDGKPYGNPITLPYNGAWSYVWHNLETNHYWTVEETPLKDYKAKEPERVGNTFIITNVCDQPDTPNNPTSPSNPKLPQTGQLWWPVPVLIAAGLLFIVVGLVRRRGIADEK